MYQLAIVDSSGNVIGVCTDSKCLPDVNVMYPGKNYIGVETPYDIDLLFNYPDYFYNNGELVKKLPISYQITRQYIKPDECTKLLVPNGTVALICGIEYLIDDGIIEYSNPNVGVHKIMLTMEGYKDTPVNVEVIGA